MAVKVKTGIGPRGDLFDEFADATHVFVDAAGHLIVSRANSTNADFVEAIYAPNRWLDARTTP